MQTCVAGRRPVRLPSRHPRRARPARPARRWPDRFPGRPRPRESPSRCRPTRRPPRAQQGSRDWRGVPKVVKPDPREAGHPQVPLEPERPGVRADHRPVLTAEHRPGRRDGRCACLGRSSARSPNARLCDRLPHGDPAGGEVDVAPPQPEHLTATHPGRCGEPPGGVVEPVIAQIVEGGTQLRSCPRAHPQRAGEALLRLHRQPRRPGCATGTPS